MTHTSSTIDIPTVEPISSMRATQKVALLMSFPPKAELNRRLDSPAQAPTDVFNSSSSDTFHSRIINDAKINLLEGLVHVAGHCRLDHSTITGGVQTAPANMGVEDVRRSFCTSATVIDIPSNSSFVNNIPITSSTPSVTGIDVSKTPVPLQQLIAVNLTRKVTNVRPLSLTVSDDRNLRGVGNFIFPPILKTFDAQTVDPNPNPNIIVSHRETTYSSSRSLVTLEAVPAAACLNSPSDCGQCSEIIAITPTSQVTSININSSLSQQHVTGTVPLSSAVGNQSSLTTPSSSNLPLREAPIDSPISQESRKSFNTTSPLKGGKDLHFSRKKVFSCTTCDKVYASAWGLKVHTRVHSSAPLFNCKFCKYRAVTSSGLVRHLRRHSRDRPFACSLCKKMFKSKCALKIHCDLHAGRKSHGCEICGKKFVQKSALRYFRWRILPIVNVYINRDNKTFRPNIAP
ncbi:Zinc finger C2H2-type [Trinorchestia longiramus]|nr:Zinc finger C2H2-type [Trinorchestia longiramus]